MKKIVICSVLFLVSATLVAAHSGHGTGDSEIAHYLGSSLHVAPTLVAGIVAVMMAMRRARRVRHLERVKNI